MVIYSLPTLTGYIKYVHDQSEPAGTVVFKFTVSDPETNELIDQSFIITVQGKISPDHVWCHMIMVQHFT